MSLNDLYEKFFNLRNAQSNAQTPAERARLQKEIEKVQNQIDKMK